MTGQKTYTREDDERALIYLHMRENLGMTTQAVSDALRGKRFSASRGSIIGHLNRTKEHAPPAPCKCRKKANKDGGMPALWWQK